MNNIIVSGRLTADPTIRTGSSGKAVCAFHVAVDRKSKEKLTDFFPCVAFDKTGENIDRFFGKGSRIICRGAMQCDIVEKNGEKRAYWKMVVNEFDFCDSKQNEPKAEEPKIDEPQDDDFPF